MLAITAALSAVVGITLYRKKVLHPRAFGTTEAKQRDVWGVPAPVWFVCGALVFLAMTFFAGLAQMLPPQMRGDAGEPRALAVSALLGYAGALVIGGILVWFIWPRTTARTGLRAAWSDAWVGLGCLALVAPFYVLVNMGAQAVQQLVTNAPPPEVAHKTLEMILSRRSDPWIWGIVIAAVVLAPVVEELIYRVFLQSCLLNLIGRTWPAILATSVPFVLVHIPMTPAAALPGLFVLSVALGMAYERTRSIGVPMVMHIGFNAANVVMAVVSAGR